MCSVQGEIVGCAPLLSCHLHSRFVNRLGAMLERPVSNAREVPRLDFFSGPVYWFGIGGTTRVRRNDSAPETAVLRNDSVNNIEWKMSRLLTNRARGSCPVYK